MAPKLCSQRYKIWFKDCGRNNCFYFFRQNEIVVYFEQHLGAAHSECWSKYAFSAFVGDKAEKSRKSKKFVAKSNKKIGFDKTRNKSALTHYAL